MRGEAVKCDNCGVVEFVPEPTASRYGRLAFIFKDYVEAEDGEEELTGTIPAGWLSVANETINTKKKTIDQHLKHFCSTQCLEFAVRYIYGNQEVPTTNEGEK